MTLLLIAVFFIREEQAAHAEAEAASLATEARLALAYDPLKAVALASEAVDLHSSVSANSALLQSILSVSSNLVRVWNLSDVHPVTLAVDPDTGLVAAGGEGGITYWHAFDAMSTRSARVPLNSVAAAPNVRSGFLSLTWVGGSLLGVREDGTLLSTDRYGESVHSVKLSDTTRVTSAALGKSGGLILADSTDKSIHYFDCVLALKQGAAGCTGRVIGTGYPSALALDDQHGRAAVGFDDEACKSYASLDSRSKRKAARHCPPRSRRSPGTMTATVSQWEPSMEER